MGNFNWMQPSMLFGLLGVAYSVPVFGEECPVGWSDTWMDKTSETAQAKSAEIVALEEYAFTLTGADTDRLGIRTDGLLVVQHGNVLYEKYARGFTAQNKHLQWSVTKSINSALLGRAVQENLLDIDASICTYYGDVPVENCAISAKNLVTFSSGLDWTESYEGKSNQASSVLAMLYGIGSQDMAGFVAGHARRDEPGSVVSYSTGDATLLSAVIGEAVSTEFGAQYPWTMLFEPLGISASYERDAKGTYVGGSYAYLTPRDMLRFGQLYLEDGCVQGERILPEGWVAQSTTPSEFFLEGDPCCEDDPVGFSWWLNVDVPERNTERPYPDLPTDLYYASGHWGQTILVIPSWDVIIVRTADDRDGSWDFNKGMSLALQLAEQPAQ